MIIYDNDISCIVLQLSQGYQCIVTVNTKIVIIPVFSGTHGTPTLGLISRAIGCAPGAEILELWLAGDRPLFRIS